MSTTSPVPVVASPTIPAAPDNTRSRGMLLSLIGLIAGLLALALVLIPSIALERPLPNPFETPEEAQRRIAGPPVKKGGIGIKIKDFEIRFGGKEVKDPVVPRKPELTKDPVRWFLIGGGVCALIGLAVSTVAHVREQHAVITTVAICCSIVAITWQFVVLGIMLGIAAVIVILITMILVRQFA
jgi:hypothetical protein